MIIDAGVTVVGGVTMPTGFPIDYLIVAGGGGGGGGDNGVPGGGGEIGRAHV